MNENNKKPIIGVFAFPINPDEYPVPSFSEFDEYYQKYASKKFNAAYKIYRDSNNFENLANNKFAKQLDLINALSKSGAEVRMIFPTRVDVNCVNTRLRDYAKRPLNTIEISLLGMQMEGVSALVCPGGDKHYPGEYYMVESIIEMGMPYLGICAGCQMLASINKRGKDGGIFNDIVGLKALDKTNEVYTNHSNINNIGKVEIIKGTPLYDILKTDSLNVKWMHGLVSNYTDSVILPAAYTKENVFLNDPDLKENILYMGCYVNGSKFQVGVQWHPEKYYEDENNKRLFDEFVINARNSKAFTKEDTIRLMKLIDRQQKSPSLRPTRRTNTYQRMVNDLQNIVNNGNKDEKVGDVLKRF